MSLVEAVTNVAVGYGVAVTTQLLVFPVFGLEVRLVDKLLIGGAFTVVSIARAFTLRRVFEAIRLRKGGLAVRCQTAFNIDPRSACKIDPPEWPTGATGPQARPAAAQERFLKRQLSLPVSMISQWWVRRSSSAVVILGSPKTDGHSPKARLVVMTIEVRS